MTYKGFSATDFARTAATTLAHHMRDVEHAMLRNYQLGALEASGQVNYNNGGRGFDWPVQYRLHAIEGNTGETTRNFARTNLWKVANLEYRGYQVVDSMYHKEMLENRGPEGVVKVFSSMTQRLEESIKQGFGTQYYVDGNASGNEESWHGLESIFGIDGTVNVSTGAQRTANAADYVGYPSDTYAGLSTILGNYGGDQESGVVWPDGIADSEYDFWSPIVVNYTSTAFGGAADTWAAQGDEAMRYGIIHSQRNTTKNGQITNVQLGRDLYFDFLNLIDDKERIVISSEHSLRALGFKNTVSFDGVEVSWEAGMPAAVGYGLNYENIELKCMEDSMLRVEGPEYDIHSQAYNAVVSHLGNLKMNSPRNFFKLQAIA